MKSLIASIITVFTSTVYCHAQAPLEGFINIKDIAPSIKVELMYASGDNFTGEKMYDFHEAYLHPKAAKALAEANSILNRIHPGWKLIVYDATRPMSVQQKMWDKVKGTKLQNYVSNPRNGGGLHNYGLAVDVSIADENGDSIPMGTKVDALTHLSHIDNEEELIEEGKMSKEAIENRRLLRRVMREAGFLTIRTEWWHFNITTRSDARANYKVIE